MEAEVQLRESLKELRDLKAALDEHELVAIPCLRGNRIRTFQMFPLWMEDLHAVGAPPCTTCNPQEAL